VNLLNNPFILELLALVFGLLSDFTDFLEEPKSDEFIFMFKFTFSPALIISHNEQSSPSEPEDSFSSFKQG